MISSIVSIITKAEAGKSMNRKFCVIIDSYPQSGEEQKILLNNLKIFKKNNIDVLLTSHHPCTSEILENSTYFIFEKKNNYHFLDSDVLNENLDGVKDRIYMKYLTAGDETFRDYLVITGWSVAVTSQFFNAIKFLFGKGYDFAFYFVGDFICPENISDKIQEIFNKLNHRRNFFIQNSPNFSRWFSGLFFGFTVDDVLVNKIPNLDFSENSIYQRFFPNHAGEDVVLKLFSSDDNEVVGHEELDNFFGADNWNLSSSAIMPGKSSLHATTISSIYSKEDLSEFSLLLEVDYNCFAENVKFTIEILSDDLLESLFYRELILGRGGWYKEKIDRTFFDREVLFLNKKVESMEDGTCFFSDTIEIRKENLSNYSFLKNYYHL